VLRNRLGVLHAGVTDTTLSPPNEDDKRLAGIQAVQTLSRLNRFYPGKEDTKNRSSQATISVCHRSLEVARVNGDIVPPVVALLSGDCATSRLVIVIPPPEGLRLLPLYLPGG
jgi:hypothetical protein